MFSLNLEMAKQIWLNKYRRYRDGILQKLDIEYMRAFELNDTIQMEVIKNKKKELREFTNIDLESITHPNDLNNLWPRHLINNN